MNLFSNNHSTETVTEDDILTIEEPKYQVILYNDDFNTFEFVIETLIKVCKHEPLQAEQCTYLVHFAGKCSVKIGSWDELSPICDALLIRGLTAAIESLS